MAQLPILCLAAQLVTLPLASMTVGLPALVGSGVSLPLATLAALVPATMIAWSLPGMSAADVAAVRNTWLMDRAALLVLIAGMMALGAVMIPVYGTARGRAGAICGRTWLLRGDMWPPVRTESWRGGTCLIPVRLLCDWRAGRWTLVLLAVSPDDDACLSIAVCVAVLVVSACVCGCRTACASRPCARYKELL